MRAFPVLLRTAAASALVLSLALAPGRSARAGDDVAPPPAADVPATAAPPATDAPVTVATPPRTFAKPAEAVLAWIVAFEKNDDAALTALLGSEGADLVTDGKDPRVAEERTRLASLARSSWSFDRTNEAEGVLRIEVGAEKYPTAIPVIRVEGGWRFDAAAGRTELLARRVGRNELEAIDLCRQYVEMQVEYASKDRDGDDVREYAQRVASQPGSQDGLYWESTADENAEASPLGLALATIGDTGSDATPYGGYRWSILRSQGAHAPGGACDYVINGNMIAGFALVAAPAEYRLTGVMTFLVSNHGKVFQKDLGPTTETLVGAMVAFDVDDTWTELVELDDAVAALAAAASKPTDAVLARGPDGHSVPVPTKAPGAVPPGAARPVGPDCGPKTAAPLPTASLPTAPVASEPLPSEPRPSEPRIAAPALDPRGTFDVTYTDGTRHTVTVTDLETVTWLAVEGVDKGATATETVDRREIAPGVWYVSWQQKDGAVVTQIVDLSKLRVISTRAMDGKRTVLEGTIVRAP